MVSVFEFCYFQEISMSETCYRFCENGSQFRSIPKYHLERVIGSATFPGRRRIGLEENPDSVADEVIRNNLDEFCWSLYFEPEFLVRLFYSGFLPIARDLGLPNDPVYCLLPKLHFKRSVIDVENFQVSSSKRKKLNKSFPGCRVSVDASFEQVINFCLSQHGDNNWLFPPLRKALSHINSHSGNGPVKVHSVEFTDPDGRIIAGDIGYEIGSIYTSMTGFYSASGAGSALLYSLASWLKLKGFTTWDLGMEMDYKRDLGAKVLNRVEWIKKVRDERILSPLEVLSGSVLVKDLLVDL